MNSSVVSVVATSAAVDLWSPVVIALIPVLVMAFKRLVPKEFAGELKIIHPILALVLGPIVDYLFSLVTSHQTGPHAALFGLLAIGLREVVDQGKKLVATPAALLVVVGLAGALSGCATTALLEKGPASLADVKAAVKADITVDLDFALAMAVAHNDQLAIPCYPALKSFFGTSTPSTDQIKGVISAFEKARVTRMAVEGSLSTGFVPVELKLACAPLLMDERDFLIRLGVLTGAGVATGGALPALSLPTLPLLLPK